MAFANRRTLLGKVIGWNVFFSHTEAEGIAKSNLTMPALLSGVTGPRVPPLLMAIPRQTWAVACATGGHDGVKAIVNFYPPAAILVPR